MTKFTYNNSKNASTNDTLFKFNCGYYPHIFLKNKHNLYFRFLLANELDMRFKKIKDIYYQNWIYFILKIFINKSIIKK